MEETKYYTPAIEDLFIGYECELMNYGEYASTWDGPLEMSPNWEKTTMDWGFMRLVEHSSSLLPLDRIIRTPYLTKEQIEAERWSYFGLYSEPQKEELNEGVIKFRKEGKDISYILTYDFNTHKMIVLPIEFGEYASTMSYQIVFDGLVTSINELRKIIKLLDI